MINVDDCEHVESRPRFDVMGYARLVWCKKCHAIKHDIDCPCCGYEIRAQREAFLVCE